jgi:hypothetical protein
MPPRPRHGYPAALHRGLPARPEYIARRVPADRIFAGTHRIQHRSTRFELACLQEA